MKRAIAVAALLASCAHSSAQPVNGPDGLPGWWSIRCTHDSAECLDKAGEVCPGGYETAYADHNERPVPAAAALGNDTPIYHGSLLIRCK